MLEGLKQEMAAITDQAEKSLKITKEISTYEKNCFNYW